MSNIKRIFIIGHSGAGKRQFTALQDYMDLLDKLELCQKY